MRCNAQGPHSEEHAPEKPGEPDQAPEASGQSGAKTGSKLSVSVSAPQKAGFVLSAGAQSPEEGETGSSESSSDDCNSQDCHLSGMRGGVLLRVFWDSVGLCWLLLLAQPGWHHLVCYLQSVRFVVRLV